MAAVESLRAEVQHMAIVKTFGSKSLFPFCVDLTITLIVRINACMQNVHNGALDSKRNGAKNANGNPVERAPNVLVSSNSVS